MEVASKTLREVEFRQQLRGYHQDDVDEFLERVAAGIEVLQDRLREATERAERAERALSEGGTRDGQVDNETVRRTLVLAQRTADMAVKEAREEAAKLVTEAEARARTLVTEAEARARNLVSEAEERARTLVANAESQAKNRIEEGERQLREDVARLTATRAELSGQVSALEEHIRDERQRVQESLNRALAWFGENVGEQAERPAKVSKAMEESAGAAEVGSEAAEGHPDAGSATGEAETGTLAAAAGGDHVEEVTGERESGEEEAGARPGGGELSAREQLGRMLESQSEPAEVEQARTASVPVAGERPRREFVASSSGERPEPDEDPRPTRLMPMTGNSGGRSLYDAEESEQRGQASRSR
jgi:DivIVA domain-containing protein